MVIIVVQVKSLNARIAKHLGVTDAASSNTAVYLGSDNVKMSRLEVSRKPWKGPEYLNIAVVMIEAIYIHYQSHQ